MNGVWTNNWRALKNLLLMGNVKAGMDTLITTYGNAIPTTVPDNPITAVSAFSAFSTNETLQYNTISVGTSTQTPTTADNRLITAASGISRLSISNDAITYDTESGTATKVVKLLIQNQSNSSITLNEWGVFQTIRYYYKTSGGSTTFTQDTIMLYRELFDVPVTLASYESATLTLTLTLTLNDPL